MCSTFQLTQLIQEPTRITPSSSTRIDVICVSGSMVLNTKKSGTLSIGLSDNSLVYIIIGHNPPKSKPEIFSFRSFRHFIEEDFVKDLSSVQWDGIFSKEDDVECSWKKFKETFTGLTNKHAPYVSVRKKQSGSPWITTGYLALARDRDYHKRKFTEMKKKSTETGQTDNGSLNELWEKFKSLRNKANNLNKRLKK